MNITGRWVASLEVHEKINTGTRGHLVCRLSTFSPCSHGTVDGIKHHQPISKESRSSCYSLPCQTSQVCVGPAAVSSTADHFLAACAEGHFLPAGETFDFITPVELRVSAEFSLSCLTLLHLNDTLGCFSRFMTH